MKTDFAHKHNFPVFDEDTFETCKNNLDFRPILFEWYKYVGLFCLNIACISKKSPALKNIPTNYFAIIVGLLNRCSRLMLANTRLSCTRKYGETTKIIDRCISESAIKIRWLCDKNHTERFDQYLTDGLKNDLLLKSQIEKNIEARNGKFLVIEERMLNSIDKRILLSGFSEQEILNCKKIADFFQMCEDLNIEKLYLPIQRMGSHAVHGTWSNLTMDYLIFEDNNVYPSDHEIETQDAQFIINIRFVISSIRSAMNFLIDDNHDKEEILITLNEIEREMEKIQKLSWEPLFTEI